MTDTVTTEQDNYIGPPDDMSSIAWDGLSSIPFFTVLISIVIYILLSTSEYNKFVLHSMSKDFTDDTGNKTASGVVVTGILFGILLGIIEAMRAAGWV